MAGAYRVRFQWQMQETVVYLISYVRNWSL